MRRIAIGAWLLLAALTAHGEDSPLVMLFDGGFAPRGASFRVAFGFSDMSSDAKSAKEPRALASPGMELSAFAWSSPQGPTARLEICCVQHAGGLGDATLAAARLRVTNPTDHLFKTSLAVVIAPEGGMHALAFEQHSFLIEGRAVLVADTPSRGAILAASPFAPRPLTPQDVAHVESVKGECRGEMLFDLALAPGQTQVLGFICPAHLPKGTEPKIEFYRTLSVDELFVQGEKETVQR
ncbi:MAG: hypothetical protein ABJF10_25930 [Chthoniobacter sp.]|uniref:hypothetical protein n=1 Tax=Chthoniobacter sp. TaxID=2510640 RepID=UPI0032A9A84A